MKRLKISMKTLRSDLVSGFSTGLFSIPEGMAYAKLAGVNPVYGVYPGMISTIVASLTTGSILMISTRRATIPTTITATTTTAIMTTLAAPARGQGRVRKGTRAILSMRNV